jgi:hypothetical protein
MTETMYVFIYLIVNNYKNYHHLWIKLSGL